MRRLLIALAALALAAPAAAQLVSPLGPLPVAQGGTGDTGTAWTTYTPGLSSSSGGLTSATAAGAYKQIGKTLFLRVVVTITTNGTAAGYLIVSLPATTVASAAQTIAGRENNTGASANVFIGGSATNMVITKYDNTYPGGDGRTIVVQGAIELQ